MWFSAALLSIVLVSVNFVHADITVYRAVDCATNQGKSGDHPCNNSCVNFLQPHSVRVSVNKRWYYCLLNVGFFQVAIPSDGRCVTFYQDSNCSGATVGAHASSGSDVCDNLKHGYGTSSQSFRCNSYLC